MESLYVAIHASESRAVGQDGGGLFSPDERRARFVYDDWVQHGSHPPMDYFRALRAIENAVPSNPPAQPTASSTAAPPAKIPSNPTAPSTAAGPSPLQPSRAPDDLAAAPLNETGALTPQASAADRVASIMRGVLHPGSPSPDSSDQPDAATPGPGAKASVLTKKPGVIKGGRPQTPLVRYNPLTASKREEINKKVSDFHHSLREFAASNGVNPADVTRHALGGELKGMKVNYWKSFQLVSRMARSSRTFIPICICLE